MPATETEGFSLDFSQIFKFVKSPPVAGHMGSGLPGRKSFAANPDECRHPVRISHGSMRNAGSRKAL
jgi:hypothetical protein